MRLSVPSRRVFIQIRTIGVCALLLAFGACSGGAGSGQSAGGGGGTGGVAGTTGGSPAGGAGGTATSAGAGGSSDAGTSGAGLAGTGGSSNGGGTGGTAEARGGAGGSNGGAGTSGAAGAGRGGSGGAAGRGGSGGLGASGGSGGTTATACTRDLLRGTITAYFTALAAHSASTLPLADNVKFTENGKTMTLGDGLWKTAGAVKYSQSALDVEICSTATHAIVPDGSINMDIPVALRLKLQNQKITEIETIAVRPGDYKLGTTTYASNTSAIIAANNTLMWESAPSGQRNTRAELTAWIDKYFRMFPRGVCNTVSSCKRLENGGGSFNCSDASTSCAAGSPTGTPAMLPRILLADPDTGIGVGMTMFMGNTDMHMFKMYGGQVYAVHAILGGASSSGWD